MGDIIQFFIIIFSVILIIEFIKAFSKRKTSSDIIPYTRKGYFLTEKEKELFAKLNEWFGYNYYIFPQVNISSLVDVEGSYKNKYSYRNKIDRKSVDFVIFDKRSISPLLVIELDDYTHDWAKRRERDIFVNEIFQKINLPIMHIRGIDSANKEEIEKYFIPNENN